EIEHNRNDPHLYLRRACLYYFERDEANNARADLDRAIELDPKFVDAYITRIGVDSYLNDYLQAKADAAKALALAPKSTLTYTSVANFENSLEEYDKGLRDSQKALQLDPTNYSAVGILADSYHGSERFEKCNEAYTRQIAMQQPHPHQLVYLS